MASATDPIGRLDRAAAREAAELRADRAVARERDQAFGRLLNGAYQRVRDEWGPAFENLGVRIQRALVAEAILILAAGQDESIAPQTVRRIVERGWEFVTGMVES